MEQNKEVIENNYTDLNIADCYTAQDGTVWASEQDYNLYVEYTQKEQVSATPEQMNDNSQNARITDINDFFFLSPDNKYHEDQDLYIISAFTELPYILGDEGTVWIKGQYLITPDGKLFLDSISAQLHMNQIYADAEYSMKEITMDELSKLRDFYVEININMEDPCFEKIEQIMSVLKSQQISK